MPYQKFAEKLRRDIEKLGYEVNKTKWDIDGERFEYLIVNTGKGKVSLNIQRYWQEAFEKGYQMMFASVAKIAQGKV